MWLFLPQHRWKVHQKAFGQVWGQRQSAFVPQVLGQLGVSLPRRTFTLEALGVNCDTGVPEQLAATARLHILRCLLRLATLSERLPHLGTGINAWEKIDREIQGSWARRDLGWLWGIPLWYLELFLLRRGKKAFLRPPFALIFFYRFFWSNLRLF